MGKLSSYKLYPCLALISYWVLVWRYLLACVVDPAWFNLAPLDLMKVRFNVMLGSFANGMINSDRRAGMPAACRITAGDI